MPTLINENPRVNMEIAYLLLQRSHEVMEPKERLNLMKFYFENVSVYTSRKRQQFRQAGESK
jgi:hypothetical protein